MIDFLKKREHKFKQVEQGIDYHLSDDEAKQYQKLAKEIDKQRHFTIYGCQKCINELNTI